MTSTDASPASWRRLPVEPKLQASPRRGLLLAVGVLAGLAAFVIQRAVFLGEVFFDRDIHWIWQPQVESWVRAVAEGSWPVWDRSIAFGQPLLADPSAQILYPASWLNLLVQPWIYYTVFVLFHLVFSGLGLFLLGRRLGLSDRAALTGGAVWMLSGPFFSLANVYHHFTSAAWMPWVLLAVERAGQDRKLREAVPWGAAAGLQLLGGSADMCMMTGLLSLLLLGRHIRWRKPGDPENRRLLVIGLTALVLAVGLAAAQWLPTLELAVRSARWSLPDRVQAFWSLHPWSLVQTLYPFTLHDLPLRAGLGAALFEGREPFLLSVYLGLPSAVLAAVALAGRRSRLALSLAAVAVGAVLVALGPHTPLHAAAVAILPPLRMLRFPQKALVVLALCWALLVGLGHDAWSGGEPLRRRRLVAFSALMAIIVGATLVGAWRPDLWLRGLLSPGLSATEMVALGKTLQPRLLMSSSFAVVALAVALIARRRWPSHVALLLAGLATLDLALAHRGLHRTGTKELYTYRPPLVDVLAGSDHRRIYVHLYGLPGEGLLAGKGLRLLGREDAFTPSRVVPGWSVAESSVLAVRSYLAPPIASVFGLESSYDLDARGLYPTPLSWLTQLARVLEGTPAHVFLLRLGAVRFVTALHRVEPAELEEVAREPGYFADPIRVFRVPDPLPRAFAVSGVRVADRLAALEQLRYGTFDPAMEVLLPEGDPAPPAPGFVGRVAIERMKTDRVELDAELSHDGLVVLVDSFDPGWQATMDGHPARLLRANVAFTAVRVPAGRHRIELTYRPRSLLVGLALSLAAGALGVALLVRLRD